MPQSLAKIYVHLAFSTRGRARVLHEAVRDDLHRYAATVLANMGCHALAINSTDDHMHLLVELARTVSVSAAVEEVKKSSSRWLKTQPGVEAGFAWQGGYGAFSVSAWNVPAVREYVARQREHHHTRSFQEDVRALLERHGVEYNERYLWD
jgi:putative transposase